MDALEALSHKHSLDILSILREERRFNEIVEKTGLTSNQVSVRLKDFRMAGLVEKGEGRMAPYTITDKGEQALEIAERIESL